MLQFSTLDYQSDDLANQFSRKKKKSVRIPSNIFKTRSQVYTTTLFLQPSFLILFFFFAKEQMEPILGQIVPVPIRRKHSWAGGEGVRINLNEAITELNLPRLICIHPVNSIIYVNAAEMLELIRLPVRTSSFPRRGSGSEMEEGKSVRKRREKKGKLK